MGDHSLSPLQEEDLLEDLNVYLCTQILGAGLHCEKEIIWIIFSCRKSADLGTSVQRLKLTHDPGIELGYYL